MAKSLRDIRPTTNLKFFDQPLPLSSTRDQPVSAVQYLYEKHGIPTPISGDPVAG